ncbi:MAG TPA: hypothetical protein VI796_02755 [Candidatus Thermoplasmatota archaeon]|nr:hypothetical protein [Candidatus Thermoplasmatota archaeon]
MLLRLAGRLVWGTAKFATKHVLVPIAITAATAIVLGKLADRIAPKAERGHVVRAPGGEPYVDLDLQPQP